MAAIFTASSSPNRTSPVIRGKWVLENLLGRSLALQQRHADEFIRNTVRRLSAFALGRALKPQDEGLVRHLLKSLEDNGLRADALLEAIVLSEALRTQG